MIHAAKMVGEETLEMSRLFDAPRDLVYRVWTDPRYVALWWGIEGATNPVCEMDLRPGGKWRITMRTSGGTEYPNGGRYLEVVEGEKLVYTDEPTEMGERNASPARGAVHTVTFADNGQGTRVTLLCRFESREQRDRVIASGFTAGVNQGFDRLERLLSRFGSEQAEVSRQELAR